MADSCRIEKWIERSEMYQLNVIDLVNSEYEAAGVSQPKRRKLERCFHELLPIEDNQVPEEDSESTRALAPSRVATPTSHQATATQGQTNFYRFLMTTFILDDLSFREPFISASDANRLTEDDLLLHGVNLYLNAQQLRPQQLVELPFIPRPMVTGKTMMDIPFLDPLLVVLWTFDIDDVQWMLNVLPWRVMDRSVRTGRSILGRCLLIQPSISKSMFRPPEDCAMCVSVREAARVTNISAREFEEFAYGARPLIVTDGAAGWRAMMEFNYEFFKDFYSSGGKMGTQTNDCFYFAYKSGLNSLKEVFSMPESRANLSGEPWYVGWSSCFDEETRRLRAYYNRPYFLPLTAESDMVDWIFMGGPGQGAHMHVDSVKHMSWQAQIRGRKQWQLAPPPECLYSCHWFNFTVAPGEVLVVDTNRWYHKTNVLPGEISITIGAEYD